MLSQISHETHEPSKERVMNRDFIFPTSPEPCIPCEAFAGGPEPAACSRGSDYLSHEEEQILAVLRDLKERARFLRGKIKSIGFAQEGGSAGAEGPGDSLRRELREAMGDLDALRKEWRQWEARLRKANARKLALLGHGRWEEAGS